MGTTRGRRLVLVTMLSCSVGVSGSSARAQDGDEAADPVLLAGERFGKDQVSRSHCAPNGESVTFSGVTTWDLCFSAVSKYGLIIQLADFRKDPAAPFVRVLFDARISEIFVPYHPGTPRLYDVSNASYPLLTLSTTDCPAPHTIVGGGKVCREIRDRGLAWKNDSLARRGEELVLWGVLDAANYNYILEWAFRDDGTITGRAGSTGPKLGGPNDTTGHMHNFSWRLDFDLNGSAGDSVRRATHLENLQANPSSATDSEVLVALEASVPWKPVAFSSVEIEDDVLKNGNGRVTSYELVPYRTGTARHTEPFSQTDFWVTAANPAQLLARNLSSYLNGQDVSSADIVVWYTGSAHHEDGMRDEDRDTVPVMWTGFELVPKNLFERTPLFP
jgi:Cu2+-containing amine oxidase